jgi:hypothetical protein
MRKALLTLAPIAILAMSPTVALADGTVPGAAGGAITGAVVGGPVGAAIGGIVGAVLGTAVDPPPTQVVAYVDQVQPPPPVVYQGSVVVGQALPAAVPVYPVPETVYQPTNGAVYAYAFVNGQRVIVDTRTNMIVAIAG